MFAGYALMTMGGEFERPSDVLRRSTRAAHERIERNPMHVRVMAPDLMREEYVVLIGRLLGFYAPLEAKLVTHLSDLESDGLAFRSRTPLLRRDLLALGKAPDAIDALPVCTQLPDVSTRSRALGALYVFEGASLGGQIIARHLRDALEIDASNGAAFYAGSESETGRAWRRFRRGLDVRLTDESSTGQAVDAANATFEAMDNWLGGSIQVAGAGSVRA